MLLLAAALLFSPGISAVSQTFGNGLAGVPICGSSAPPTVILNHTLTNATHAVLHHFWATGAPLKIDRMWVEYYLDGETTPSIAFQPSFMCGLQYPELVPHDFEFSAGGLCGKSAPVGGFSNTFQIPFYRSALVTARAHPSDGPGCFGGYLSVRGSEELPLAVPGSGRPLPFGTRLLLQANPPATRAPLDFVTVAALPAGQRGEVFQVAWAIEAQPEGGPAAGGGYIEGCWNFHPTATTPYPGIVVGTGVEDYFDSGYYFGADSGDAVGVLFANALSGLTLFQRAAPYERLSAYRFHNTDPLVMADGGVLTWQVGAQGHPGATKCGNPAAAGTAGLDFGPPRRSRAGPLHPVNASRALSPINATTYAWVYLYPGPFGCDNSTGIPTCAAAGAGAGGNSWSADCCSAPPPAPPGPTPTPTPTPVPGPPSTVGCASGECAAFCSNPAVHGCAAGGWGAAGLSLRAAPSGKGCGGTLGPCTASPADACAPGWALCLADAAADAAALARFRANISAAECAGEAGVAYVAAMSHSNPEFQSLPPKPCACARFFFVASAPCPIAPHPDTTLFEHTDALGAGPPAPVTVDNGCAANGWGAEPVCCGQACAVPSCPNSLWIDGTMIHEDEGDGCGALGPGTVDGVLCCKVQ